MTEADWNALRPFLPLLPLLLLPLAVPFAFLSAAAWNRVIRRHGPRGQP